MRRVFRDDIVAVGVLRDQVLTGWRAGVERLLGSPQLLRHGTANQFLGNIVPGLLINRQCHDGTHQGGEHVLPLLVAGLRGGDHVLSQLFNRHDILLCPFIFLRALVKIFAIRRARITAGCSLPVSGAGSDAGQSLCSRVLRHRKISSHLCHPVPGTNFPRAAVRS